MVTIDCPACKRVLRLPENTIKQSLKCPGCGTVFTAMCENGMTQVQLRTEEQLESLSVRLPLPQERVTRKEPPQPTELASGAARTPIEFSRVVKNIFIDPYEKPTKIIHGTFKKVTLIAFIIGFFNSLWTSTWENVLGAILASLCWALFVGFFAASLVACILACRTEDDVSPAEILEERLRNATTSGARSEDAEAPSNKPIGEQTSMEGPNRVSIREVPKHKL